MLSREQFEAELAPLRAAVEQRRKRYLRYYYAGMGAAILLLASALFFPAAALHSVQMALGVHAPLKPSDILAFRVFAVLCAISLTLGPVMSYRGERGFSVERAIYARILSFFGDFIPAAGGGIRAADVRKDPLFAPPLLFAPEEGVMGEMNGVRVRLCEAAFFKREEEEDRLVFNGLFILCDLPQNAREADTGPIRKELEHLAHAAKALIPEKAQWDEKLTYALGALYARAKNAALMRVGKNELPVEKEYRLKYALHPKLARAGLPLSSDAFCDPYGLAYSRERCLVAVAGPGGLFTLSSLFTPALAADRMQRLYEVMESVGLLTRHVSGAEGARLTI